MNYDNQSLKVNDNIQAVPKLIARAAALDLDRKLTEAERRLKMNPPQEPFSFEPLPADRNAIAQRAHSVK